MRPCHEFHIAFADQFRLNRNHSLSHQSQVLAIYSWKHTRVTVDVTNSEAMKLINQKNERKMDEIDKSVETPFLVKNVSQFVVAKAVWTCAAKLAPSIWRKQHDALNVDCFRGRSANIYAEMRGTFRIHYIYVRNPIPRCIEERGSRSVLFFLLESKSIKYENY